MPRRLLARFKGPGGNGRGDGPLPPLALTPELVAAAIEVFGQGERPDNAIEADMLALAGHPLTARRLVDVIPEAFGLVLVAHIPSCAGMEMAQTFSARSADGEWRSIPSEREPLFALAATTAMRMYHDGPRDRFRAIATRASTVNAVSQALDQVDSLEGASMAGPAFNGIPAELYSA
ncbi:hypothetical protein IEQ11_19965 [Lysobacter capsici]|uniref:hypothetical protein n=1 Tax=Lysobacter capsici TaxID=435897 RepID=UPI00177E44AA|nr:hypothetical protein [Lysobacter capsici]UOF13980.1 hypothetical protein IEQ11_19965 [Lysobacter capsici]